MIKYYFVLRGIYIDYKIVYEEKLLSGTLRLLFNRVIL